MTIIFDWKDKRAMLECLSDSTHDLRLCLVRDVAPNFPEFAEELEAVGGDLTAAIDKLYTIMERSIDEEGPGDDQG